MDQLVKYLAGNTFKVYRASGLPFTNSLLKQDRDTISVQLAKCLYQIYNRNRSKYDEDFVVRYNSYRAIQQEIGITSGSFDDIQFVNIKSRNGRLLPRQTLVFSRKGDQETILLNRVTSNREVNECLLHTLQLLTNTLFVDYIFPPHFIPLLINKLLPFFENDLRLVYEIHQTKLLNNVEIDIDYPDVKLLRLDSSGDHLYESICRFMYNSSKIRFDRLSIKKFVSDVMNISNDGRVRFNTVDVDKNELFILELIGKIHSAVGEYSAKWTV